MIKVRLKRIVIIIMEIFHLPTIRGQTWWIILSNVVKSTHGINIEERRLYFG